MTLVQTIWINGVAQGKENEPRSSFDWTVLYLCALLSFFCLFPKLEIVMLTEIIMLACLHAPCDMNYNLHLSFPPIFFNVYLSSISLSDSDPHMSPQSIFSLLTIKKFVTIDVHWPEPHNSEDISPTKWEHSFRPSPNLVNQRSIPMAAAQLQYMRCLHKLKILHLHSMNKEKQLEVEPLIERNARSLRSVILGSNSMLSPLTFV